MENKKLVLTISLICTLVATMISIVPSVAQTEKYFFKIPIITTESRLPQAEYILPEPNESV